MTTTTEQAIKITCFNEMGKVSLPHSSGVLTISLVTSLHDLQTDAQKTTADLAGQDDSHSSTLLIISKSNSGGKFAHCPCSMGSRGATSGAIWDRVRLGQCFPSTPLLDLLPIPSFISINSRTMLLSAILMDYEIKSFLQLSNCRYTSDFRIQEKNLNVIKIKRFQKLTTRFLFWFYYFHVSQTGRSEIQILTLGIFSDIFLIMQKESTTLASSKISIIMINTDIGTNSLCL